MDMNIPDYNDCISEEDTYGCDGLSKDCEGGVLWDNVNWFTSSIGLRSLLGKFTQEFIR